MKSLPVRWSDAAEADLNDLADHIAESSGSIAIAIAYSRRIEARAERIGHVPFGGTARDDLLAGLRSIAFERSALICYQVIDHEVWITNVFPRGRDVDAAFRLPSIESDDQN